MACDSRSSAVQPNTLAPRQSPKTSRSVRPRMATSRTLPTAILRLAADRVWLTPPPPAGHPPRRARAPLGESPAIRSLRLDAAVRPIAAPELVVRPACRYADGAALERLAARAGARALRGGGHVLVAEWAGRIVAAVSLHDGRAVADPGGAPLDAVAVLRRHASAARPARARVALPWMPRIATRRVAAALA